MSKIDILFVIAAVAVAAQAAYPRPNDIADAIGKRDWDRLHELLAQVHREQLNRHNKLTPITPIRYQQPIAVQQYAIPQAQAFAGAGLLSSHSVGSGLSASISSNTVSTGLTTV